MSDDMPRPANLSPRFARALDRAEAAAKVVAAEFPELTVCAYFSPYDEEHPVEPTEIVAMAMHESFGSLEIWEHQTTLNLKSKQPRMEREIRELATRARSLVEREDAQRMFTALMRFGREADAIARKKRRPALR